MKVAIYSRVVNPDQQADVQELFTELTRNNIKAVIYFPFFETIRSCFKHVETVQVFHTADDLDDTIDFLISLGGDGTMLDTVTLIRNKNIPVLGINFGRLGFLASIGRKALHSAVRALVNRTYVIDKRSLIHLDGDKLLFNEMPYGLNEFAIHKTDTSPMIKIHTYLNGEFLNTYWADGVIVSTPTGSTGYSLSCGGLIVLAELGRFVITYVVTHNIV